MAYFDKNLGIVLEHDEREVLKKYNSMLQNKKYNCENIIKALNKADKYRFKN